MKYDRDDELRRTKKVIETSLLQIHLQRAAIQAVKTKNYSVNNIS
jgi:hypothetical protein